MTQVFALVCVSLVLGGAIALYVLAARRDQKLFFISWVFPFALLALLDSKDGRKAWGVFALGLGLPIVFGLLQRVTA